MIIQFTAAHFRNPMDSDTTLVASEERIECEDGGFCYCDPAPSTPRARIHDHLKVWGENPEAAPRYYAMESRQI